MSKFGLELDFVGLVLIVCLWPISMIVMFRYGFSPEWVLIGIPIFFSGYMWYNWADPKRRRKARSEKRIRATQRQQIAAQISMPARLKRHPSARVGHA
jgi:hypothetical protein